MTTKITWFLDGAHTIESLEYCMLWFCHPHAALRSSHPGKRVLIFNCTSGRSGKSFLAKMLDVISIQLRSYGQTAQAGFFDRVIFCTNVTYADGQFKGDLTTVAMRPEESETLSPQLQLAAAWSSQVPSFPSSEIHVVPSIEHAVHLVRDLANPTPGSVDVDVLVTGSLHLVGGVMEVVGLMDQAL